MYFCSHCNLDSLTVSGRNESSVVIRSLRILSKKFYDSFFGNLNKRVVLILVADDILLTIRAYQIDKT